MKGNGNKSVSVIEAIEARLLCSIVYVDANSPGPSHTGGNWNLAYTSLQLALTRAPAGTEIRVADGMYTPSSTGDRAATFTLKPGVTINGGYAGAGAANPDLRNVGQFKSVLSGDIGVAGNASDNSYNVVSAFNVDTGSLLDGVTISNGNAGGGSGAFTERGGGLIINTDSSLWDYSAPTIRNCTFAGNSSKTGGGAVYIGTFGRPTFINCVFVGNTSPQGGAVYNADQTAAIFAGCTFSGNSADSGSGIYTSSSTTVNNCVLWDGGDRTSPQIRGTGNLFGVVAKYSDVQGGYTGTGNLNVDPQFVRNPSAGLDRKWGTADDDYGDLRLQPYSPAADRGNNSLIPAGITTDAASQSRVVDLANVTNSSVGPVDMGAFEAQPALTAQPGGAYLVAQGSNTALSGHGASTEVGALQYAWDFNGDGFFDDASGASPQYLSSQLPVGSVHIVALRITDAASNAVEASTTITVIPATIYVDTRAAGGGDGTTWLKAYTDLNMAIAFALPGQSIHVATGTYLPSSTNDRSGTFWLKSGVQIVGGYAGIGSGDPNLRDVASFPSILSGEIGSSASNDNSYHVVTASGVASSAVLDGFKIVGGYGQTEQPPSIFRSGAGLYNSVGSPTIRSCTFESNSAGFFANGGACYNESGSPSFTDCSFINNLSQTGGAVYSVNCPLVTFTSCYFAGNQGAEGGGGAIYQSTGTLKATNCVFVANVALYSASGGAALLSNVTSRFDQCTFVNNTAGNGSALLGAGATLTNCIVWNNSHPETAVYASSTVLYSDVQNGFSGVGNIDADPLFLRNPSAGPDGTWNTADDDFGDLRLQAISPCVDAGDNSSVTIATDQTGNARIIDTIGVRDPGAIIDMGAYERQLPVYVIGAVLSPDGTAPAIKFSFNVPLSVPSISADDLIVRNVPEDGSLGAAIAATGFTYDSVTRQVAFTLPINILDGNYRATLPIAALSDSDGTSTSNSFDLDFFIFAGDANHDRKVDIRDLAALAMNWHGTGKVFSEGDFNYDGKVDAADLGILSGNWSRELLPPPAAQPASLIKPTTKRAPARIANLVR